ncbi:MAG: nucleotidyl transferase AbiEii/AbiGii toxin family protein [Egibacteraceae bacterium]
MLARGLDNQTATVTRLVSDIAAQDLDFDDGVGFDVSSVRAEVIRQDDLYPGVRVHVPTRIATAQIPLKLDVNFGDPVTPGPTEILYPALLHQPFLLWGPSPRHRARGEGRKRWCDVATPTHASATSPMSGC